LLDGGHSKVTGRLAGAFRNIGKEKIRAATDADHGDWYQELFGPSVAAGILKPADLDGYRTDQVL
jgi:hypothetical protein|tara:strand:- start:972 stop:1166 length:195 start_codon:yes stop_codon:yes gene_type:complete